MIGDEVQQKVRTRPCKALENMATSSPFILKIMGEPICIFYIPFHWLLVGKSGKGERQEAVTDVQVEGDSGLLSHGVSEVELGWS